MNSLEEAIAGIVKTAVTEALAATALQPEAYSARQTAVVLGLSEAQIRRLVRDGAIASLPEHITGKRVLIARNEIERILASASTTPAIPRAGVVNGAAGMPPASVTAAAS